MSTNYTSSTGQETIQLVVWILAGTSALNTLTIFFFIIQKCLGGRNLGNVEHKYAENVIEVYPLSRVGRYKIIDINYIYKMENFDYIL